jgi:hypothetical protein
MPRFWSLALRRFAFEVNQIVVTRSDAQHHDIVGYRFAGLDFGHYNRFPRPDHARVRWGPAPIGRRVQREDAVRSLVRAERREEQNHVHAELRESFSFLQRQVSNECEQMPRLPSDPS